MAWNENPFVRISMLKGVRMSSRSFLTHITCTDDQALARLKERVPAYEVIIVEEYGGRRTLKLAVPRLGLKEEVRRGPIVLRKKGT
jgi:hypothetical protein